MAKKRGNGEGTIPRRKNGGWMAQYYVYTADGRRRKTLYGKTRNEVSGKLTKAMSDRDGGLIFDAGKVTLGEYLDRWVVDSARGTVRKSTCDYYQHQLRRYVQPTLRRLPLKKLTELHVQGLYRSMQDHGLSARTVRYTHAVLHRALKQAVRWSTSRATPATIPTHRRSRETKCGPSTRNRSSGCSTPPRSPVRTASPTGSTPPTFSPSTPGCAPASSSPSS